MGDTFAHAFGGHDERQLAVSRPRHEREAIKSHIKIAASALLQALRVLAGRRPANLSPAECDDWEAASVLSVYIEKLATSKALDDAERQERVMRRGMQLAHERLKGGELHYEKLDIFVWGEPPELDDEE